MRLKAGEQIILPDRDIVLVVAFTTAEGVLACYDRENCMVLLLGPEVERCEVSGCEAAVKYEGWYRALDPFTGEPTGLIQRRRVCKEHTTLLIGGANNDDDA
jgi:hypothetical protein